MIPVGRPLPTGLAPALDATVIRESLGERVRALLGPSVRVRRVNGEILRRATIRYELELAGAPLATWRVIGKIFETRAAGESAYSAHRRLWADGFDARPPVEITIPRVFGFVPEYKLVLMEEVGGQSLKRLLDTKQARAEDLRGFAEVLAKLHRSPFHLVAPSTLDQHLTERCRGLLGPLAQAHPDLSAPIARIVATAREIERKFLPTYTLTHGDYHPGQVHVDAGRLWLLDLDLLQRRDPAYDVAMVVVRLNGLGTKRGAAGPYRELLKVFLETYFASMDGSIADRVPLHAALIFLKRACKRFCYKDEAGWLSEVRFQVRQAMDCLAVHESLRPRRGLSEALEHCTGCPGAV